jgi:hypothetical protein
LTDATSSLTPGVAAHGERHEPVCCRPRKPVDLVREEIHVELRIAVAGAVVPRLARVGVLLIPQVVHHAAQVHDSPHVAPQRTREQVVS